MAVLPRSLACPTNALIDCRFRLSSHNYFQTKTAYLGDTVIDTSHTLTEAVQLSQAKVIIESMAHEQSILLLSPPGLGKSEMVRQAAHDAGLACHSLLGTQIAAEDVSGVPRIVGERSVFCPPRILLPRDERPFCLFLDELPAAAPDIQKAFYSLLLERRLGEHRLPPGTWVVAAGNRSEDRALVRTISSALVNRVIVLQLQIDVDEWLCWATEHSVHEAVMSFIEDQPDSLLRPVPDNSQPYSTPRAWASLSQGIMLLEQAGAMSSAILRSLVYGRISEEDARDFCAWYGALREVPSVRQIGWERLRKLPVEQLPLSQGTTNALLYQGVQEVSQLIQKRCLELYHCSKEMDTYIDRGRIDEISTALASLGLKLAEADLDRPTVTLDEAKSMIKALGRQESILMLSPPGVGKSELVQTIAKEESLACHSLLGTQIAPEDVSGIPKIVHERSVFCPPRLLLPEEAKPFCLFLDELPACPPDIQKAFYSLLLERRVGEHFLPGGSLVVAAGNRSRDRSLVRTMSSALINRVFVLHIRPDYKQWLTWARSHKIRREIIAFITYMPEALMRELPKEAQPFSTPRSWTAFSHALDRLQERGRLNAATRRAIAFGLLSARDAAVFCAMTEDSLEELLPIEHYFEFPKDIPQTDTARWFLINRIRMLIDHDALPNIPDLQLNQFLLEIPREMRFALLVDHVEIWAELGAENVLLDTLKEVIEV